MRNYHTDELVIETYQYVQTNPENKKSMKVQKQTFFCSLTSCALPNMPGTLSAKDSTHVPAFMELAVSWDRLQPSNEKGLTMFRAIKTYKRYNERSLVNKN